MMQVSVDRSGGNDKGASIEKLRPFKHDLCRIIAEGMYREEVGMWDLLVRPKILAA
jgi:hypothetical protein